MEESRRKRPAGRKRVFAKVTSTATLLSISNFLKHISQKKNKRSTPNFCRTRRINLSSPNFFKYALHKIAHAAGTGPLAQALELREKRLVFNVCALHLGRDFQQ